MTDYPEEIKNFLENIPDTFDILEEGIDMETQKEYFDYSHTFEQGELSKEKTLQLSALLFSDETPPESKKKVMALLAHLGSITAYRELEKYHGNSDRELKQWAALALHECRMFLESELTEQDSVFISSGLGGAKNKMRFYFLLLSNIIDTPFTHSQQNIIQNELNLIANQLNCIVESLDFSGDSVGFTVLIPMDVAVATFIETGIENCNELGNFVFEHYYVTNMNIPNKEEIEEIIKKVRE